MTKSSRALRVVNPPVERPVMAFDGDCGFCRYWIARWRDATAGNVDYQPYQEIASRYPEIPIAAFEGAVQLIERDGRVFSGADAVFRALEYAPGKRWISGLANTIPGFRALANFIYGIVAKNRSLFSFLTWLCFGRSVHRVEYSVARRIFPRLVGLAYLVAFISLVTQIRGLAGHDGIKPATDVLKQVTDDNFRAEAGDGKYHFLPTLCWYGADDTALVSLCAAGIVISCVLIAGYLPALCLFLLWLIYLSLCQVCLQFLCFQWDALLLQTGFLTIFLVPLGLRLRSQPGRERWGGRLARWLLLWLLFCLMFESGVVKLTQGNDTWKSLTALCYHYETQPLPLWTSWYLNQSPLWFEKLSVLVMFAIELVAPFLIFGPRNFRRAACAVMIFLQVFIAFSGNYCFFNLLTIALCLLLLDDQAWPRWIRRKLLRDPGESAAKGIQWPFWAVVPVALADLFMCCLQLPQAFKPWFYTSENVQDIETLNNAFLTFNDYGLFRVMTLTRPEIIIEGSNDGVHWLTYEFPWKPGDVNRRPGLVAPFQPRLDWQMWFAALGDYRNEWYVPFIARLLQGSPDVTGLLAVNPFPDKPPRMIRSSLYEYKFTRFGDPGGAWWKREYKGLYCPVMSLPPKP